MPRKRGTQPPLGTLVIFAAKKKESTKRNTKKGNTFHKAKCQVNLMTIIYKQVVRNIIPETVTPYAFPIEAFLKH